MLLVVIAIVFAPFMPDIVTGIRLAAIIAYVWIVAGGNMFFPVAFFAAQRAVFPVFRVVVIVNTIYNMTDIITGIRLAAPGTYARIGAQG